MSLSSPSQPSASSSRVAETLVFTPSRDMVVAKGLAKQFGSFDAVQDLDLTVSPGTIVGLIGPSGSGKTTAVRLLLGIYAPSRGEVSVFGRDPRRLDARARQRLGYLPQTPALVPELTVRQNLRFLSALAGGRRRGRRRRLRDALAMVDLNEHRGKTVRQLSGGMQRRLALAGTLAHEPELVFLDEPTAGVDPILRARFWEHFRELADAGRTAIVTTQYVSEAANCDVVGVLVDGRLAVLDTPDGLRRRAHEGDTLLLESSAPLDASDVRQLEAMPGVIGRVIPTGATSVRMTVDDAGRRLPAILDETKALGVTSAQAAAPDWDDVFVRLVARVRADRGET